MPSPAADLDARAGLSAAGDERALVLLHGMSGSGLWWRRNTPVFEPVFRTYALDLPGFGASRATRWRGLNATADWLADWIETEGLERAHVAGHSLGGAVAARLAARYPARVDRLVLVDAAIRTPLVRAPTRLGDVWTTLGRREPGFVPMLVHDVLRMHPRSFVMALDDVLRRDWAGDLARIIAPTLVVWGERDPIMPIAHGRQLAARLSTARLVTLPGAGHNPMWESADAFNQEVLRFLLPNAPESEFGAAAAAASVTSEQGRAAP